MNDLEQILQEGNETSAAIQQQRLALMSTYQTLQQQTIKEAKNGDLTITSKISTPAEILMIIFHWLPHIKVISPKPIQTAVKDTIKGYLKKL